MRDDMFSHADFSHVHFSYADDLALTREDDPVFYMNPLPPHPRFADLE